MTRILVVDDEEAIRDSLTRHLRQAGHEVAAATDCAGATQALREPGLDVVLTDLRLPDGDGLGILQEVRRLHPDAPVIVFTAYATVDTAVKAMQLGAFDYVQKPFRLEELEVILDRALRHRRMAIENEYLRARVATEEIEPVWGPSAKGREVAERIRALAATDSTVLVTGESGTGKEVAARRIHGASARRERPFLAVNCAALSAGLLESELFGHEKGAFTGADQPRKGRFELADTGTILLDEVSEIDRNLQAKLLRVLQERTFERVGSSQPRRVDVRIVATSNRNLGQEVAAERFRADLYWRLNVVPLELPPLRDRREDVPALVAALLGRMPGGARKRVTPKLLKRFQEYPWPGNVRELSNILERAVVLAAGDEIAEEVVAPWLAGVAPKAGRLLEGLQDLNLKRIEEEVIEIALRRSGGNKERTAQALGMTSRGLREKLKRKENPSEG